MYKELEVAAAEASLPGDYPHQKKDKLLLAKIGADFLNNILQLDAKPAIIVPLLQLIGI